MAPTITLIVNIYLFWSGSFGFAKLSSQNIRCFLEYDERWSLVTDHKSRLLQNDQMERHRSYQTKQLERFDFLELFININSMTSSSMNFVHTGRFERCKTPMGTVPISVIMGFDYPLDPCQVQMVMVLNLWRNKNRKCPHCHRHFSQRKLRSSKLAELLCNPWNAFQLLWHWASIGHCVFLYFFSWKYHS